MKKPFITLSSALQSTGLGLFLVVGFNGCTDDKCKDLQYAPQFKVDECNKSNSGGSGSSHSSGFFMPIHSSSYGSSSESSGG